MKTPGNKESTIDVINNRLWTNRYDNPKAVADKAARNLARAEKAGYPKGIAYAKLNIATANFSAVQK